MRFLKGKVGVSYSVESSCNKFFVLVSFIVGFIGCFVMNIGYTIKASDQHSLVQGKLCQACVYKHKEGGIWK